MTNIEKSNIQEIVTLHQEIGGHLRMSLEKAIRIGELLTEQKASLKHGEWLPWIKDNLPFSDRTARVYVRCFKNKAILADSATLGSAIKLLAEPEPEPYLTSLCKDCKHWNGDLSLNDISDGCKKTWQCIAAKNPDVFVHIKDKYPNLFEDNVDQFREAINQEIDEGLEKGKTPYLIGKEVAARIEKLFEVKLKPKTSMEHGRI